MTRTARRLLGRLVRQAPAPSRRLYPSYAAARECCSGYDDGELQDVVQAKTRALRQPEAVRTLGESDLHTLLSVLSAMVVGGSRSPLKVLDFGGACGAHYYRTRQALVVAPRFQWVIVETSGMAARANALSNGSGELSAVDSVEEAIRRFGGRPDIVHASGALQCTPDPYGALGALLQVQAPFFLLTRGAVTRGDHDVIVTHESSLSANGPGPLPPQFADRAVSYPLVFARRSRFVSEIEAVYRQVLLLPDQSGCFPVNDEPVEGFAVLATTPVSNEPRP